MVDAALLELEGVVFDTRELRRISLQDALADHGLGSLIDEDVVDGLVPRAGVVAALAKQGIDRDNVLIDLIAGVGAESSEAALAELAHAGAELVESTSA